MELYFGWVWPDPVLAVHAVQVFLVRKRTGANSGRMFAMKVFQKVSLSPIIQEK